MKTILKLSFTAFLLVFVLQTFSQTENQRVSKSIDYAKLDKYVPGILFYRDLEMEKVEIYYDNPGKLLLLNNELSIKYPEKNNLFLTASKAFLEAFEIDGHKWQRITYNGKTSFGIVHIDGAIRYISVFSVPPVGATGEFKEESYYQKLDQEPISEIKFTFKYGKTIQELIKDDTELAAKVTAGEKGYKGFFNCNNVLKEYNDWYAAQNPPKKDNTAVAPTEEPAPDLGIPAGLFGEWKFFSNIIVISPGRVKAKLVSDGNEEVEWLIQSYDKETGTISGKLVKVLLNGVDVTATKYAGDYSGYFQFANLTETNVRTYFFGNMIFETPKIKSTLRSLVDVVEKVAPKYAKIK
jgi:hypothetical protein